MDAGPDETNLRGKLNRSCADDDALGGRLRTKESMGAECGQQQNNEPQRINPAMVQESQQRLSGSNQSELSNT